MKKVKKEKEEEKLIYLGPSKVGFPIGTILDELPKDASDEMKLLTVPMSQSQQVSKLIGSAGNRYSEAFRKLGKEARHV